MRQYLQDYTSASRYFYNLVEEHVHPTGSDARIRAILGSAYDPRYLNMLRYIPSEYLCVDAECLGEGQNGVVHGATLTRPKPFLCATQALETPFEGPGLPVVVKRIKAKSDDPHRISSFLREVLLSYNLNIPSG
jgi:hypothetical protein